MIFDEPFYRFPFDWKRVAYFYFHFKLHIFTFTFIDFLYITIVIEIYGDMGIWGIFFSHCRYKSQHFLTKL